MWAVSLRHTATCNYLASWKLSNTTASALTSEISYGECHTNSTSRLSFALEICSIFYYTPLSLCEYTLRIFAATYLDSLLRETITSWKRPNRLWFWTLRPCLHLLHVVSFHFWYLFYSKIDGLFWKKTKFTTFLTSYMLA